MDNPESLRSGKGHGDENFPVASRLISPRYRQPILAFYEFVRTADDIADHAELTETEKLALLDRLDAGLLGQNDEDPVAVTLRTSLRERALSPAHARDLLTAFRLDATKRRYQDWDDLMHYCAYSAMPVGRYVLDVHGESCATWPASDALCAALQVINHLQDCGKDYRDLDRVYVPLDALAAAGTTVETLGTDRASPALLRCIRSLADRTAGLMREGAALSPMVDNVRLSLEISVIHTLAQRLVGMLQTRDPLSDRVHLGKPEVAGLGLVAVTTGMVRRLGRSLLPSRKAQDA
jgi:hydroxysqualene synthase